MNKKEAYDYCIKHNKIKKFLTMPKKLQEEYLYSGKLESNPLYVTKAGYVYAIIR